MKKTLLTLSAVALLTSPSLFAAEDSLQEHLQMEQKLQKQDQQRLKDGSGSGTKNQYENQYENQYKYQNQNQYKGTNPSKPNTGSFGGQSGGGRK
jgi:Ni/Co efflux regulator RcnB